MAKPDLDNSHKEGGRSYIGDASGQKKAWVLPELSEIPLGSPAHSRAKLAFALLRENEKRSSGRF